MFFSSSKVLGLDIGTTSIKLAELNVSRSGATLVGFAMVPTPSSTFSDGELTDPSVLAAAVQSGVRKLGSKRKDAAFGLWGNALIVKKISMPKMEEKLVAEQLRWEAEQYIPFDLAEINLDYQILHSTSPESDTLDVLIVAAQKSHIFKYVEAVQMAGLKCSIIDVSAFALENCFEHNYPSNMDIPTLVIDVGAAVTNFVIAFRGEVLFSRDILFGGIQFTYDLSKSMGVSFEEAEGLKMSYSMGQASPNEVVSILSQTTEQFVEEVRSSYDFFVGSFSSPITLQQGFMTGGASRLPNLMNATGKNLGIPFSVLNPFGRIRPNSRSLDMNYLSSIRDFASTAIGLGLRKLGDR